MNRRTASLLASGASIWLALAGCSKALEIELFDASGAPATVSTSHDGVLTVEPGRSIRFRYPGPEDGWTLRLRVRACDVVYDVPSRFDRVDPAVMNGHDPLKAELVADGTIHLLPWDAAGPRPPEEVRALQVDGFPLHPASRNCAPTAKPGAG